MKILKYSKKANDNYDIYLDDNRKLTINEDIILKHKLLYKKEIDDELINELINDNNNYDIYNKCVKYIGVRLRSTNEIKEYMKRKNVDNNLIYETIDKLKKNKLLDDEAFTKAFIHDKLNFTTMGPYKIRMELGKHKIENSIIDKYIYDIDESFLEEKINKQITKLLKRKNTNKNKIYHYLLNLGYSSELILSSLNKYNL